jgi:putative peptidoglycan lipid II flippase
VFAFYARQNTLTPALVGLISLGAYMVVAVYLLPWYSLYALMVADSVKFLIHTGISAWLLGRNLGGYGKQRLIRTIARTSLAAAGMAITTVGVMALLEHGLPDGGIMGRAIVVAGAGGIGLLTFGTLASWLKVDEWRWMRDLARRRMGL